MLLPMPTHPLVAVDDADVFRERPGDGTRYFEIAGWGAMGPVQRVAFLRWVIDSYCKDPMLTSLVVHQILNKAQLKSREYRRQAQLILSWVQANIRYINEWDERIQTPWRTLQWRFGDCDDMVVLSGALAQSIGLSTRIVLAGPAADGRLRRWVEGSGWPPGGVDWSHVYLEIGWPPFHPTYWTSAEPTMTDAKLGYDVVKHGVISDHEGRIRVPRAGEQARGAMPELRTQALAGITPLRRNGWGAAETPTQEERSLSSQAFWRDALMAAIEGLPAAIVSAVAIWYITKLLEERYGP